MNLSTRYLGMKLRTPLVPSASPLSDNLDNIKHMEDAGAAAVVFHSLFEEHIQTERRQLHHHLTHVSTIHSWNLNLMANYDRHLAPNACGVGLSSVPASPLFPG
jgi:dihydroorotate dehydrogenase